MEMEHFSVRKASPETQMLAHRLRKDGFVVIDARQVRRRAVGEELIALLKAEGISIRYGETESPNHCMCVVDTERYTLEEVLHDIAQLDQLEFGT